MRGNIYIDQPFKDKFSYKNNKSKKEMGEKECVCECYVEGGIYCFFFQNTICHAMPCYAVLCYYQGGSNWI